MNVKYWSCEHRLHTRRSTNCISGRTDWMPMLSLPPNITILRCISLFDSTFASVYFPKLFPRRGTPVSGSGQNWSLRYLYGKFQAFFHILCARTQHSAALLFYGQRTSALDFFFFHRHTIQRENPARIKTCYTRAPLWTTEIRGLYISQIENVCSTAGLAHIFLAHNKSSSGAAGIALRIIPNIVWYMEEWVNWSS